MKLHRFTPLRQQTIKLYHEEKRRTQRSQKRDIRNIIICNQTIVAVYNAIRLRAEM
jgi:hypothetical protein